MDNLVTLGEIFAKAEDCLTPSFNSVRFEADVNSLSKSETENLLGTIQAEILKGGDYAMLTEMRSIALDHLNDIIKAHKDGDHHPTKPWVWVSSANGGKGDWRVEGGRSHKKAGASTTDAAAGNKVDITKIPDAEFKRITQMLEKKNPDHSDAERYLEEEAMSDKELKNFHAVAEHFKNSSKINKMTQEYCRKWAELARQELQSRNKKSTIKNQTSTPAPRKPGSTSEIERMTAQAVRSSILGLNNIGTKVRDKGDYFHIEFDANDFSTHGQRSPKIDQIVRYLENSGASCVVGKNEIKAYKKVEAKKDAKVDTSIDQEEYDKAYKKAISKEETEKHLKESLDKIERNIKEVKDAISTSSSQIVIDKMKKMLTSSVSKKKAIEDALKNHYNKKSDPRDKAAQDAGFKDYKEMEGYQDYVTQKNLLKKKSTKSGMRLLYEREVAQYEKDHADLIKRLKMR